MTNQIPTAQLVMLANILNYANQTKGGYQIVVTQPVRVHWICKKRQGRHYLPVYIFFVFIWTWILGRGGTLLMRAHPHCILDYEMEPNGVRYEWNNWGLKGNSEIEVRPNQWEQAKSESETDTHSTGLCGLYWSSRNPQVSRRRSHQPIGSWC